MKLRQLVIFDAVARHASVTLAANELGISQPAVSLQVKLLEQEYQKIFVSRSNRGVELTEQGRAFHDAIRPVLMEIDRLETRIQSGQPFEISDVLVVGGSHTVSVTILPEAVAAFREIHPEIKVELETRFSAALQKEILSGQVEIGLTSSEGSHSNCVYELYAEHEEVAFVSPDHPLCGRTISLSELSQYPLIVKKGSSGIAKIQKKGYRLNLVLRCDSYDAVKGAVRKGTGVGILVRNRVQFEIAAGALCQIEVPELKSIVGRSFIIYDRRRALSPNAADFLRVLRELKNGHS